MAFCFGQKTDSLPADRKLQKEQSPAAVSFSLMRRWQFREKLTDEVKKEKNKKIGAYNYYLFLFYYFYNFIFLFVSKL